jgi:hypothetical protein
MAAPTPQSAVPALPYKTDISLATAHYTGTVNVGDWLAYSGQFVFATNSGHSAYWKTSGAGVALESNPMYDQFGNSVLNSGGKILVEGILRVSASFSGVPALGLGIYPDATGSGVGAPTGLTGLGATWNTAQVRFNSALSGTANAQVPGVATVIGSHNFSNAGTGQVDIRLVALAPDVRG